MTGLVGRRPRWARAASCRNRTEHDDSEGAEGTPSSGESRKPTSRSVTRKTIADASSRSLEKAREMEPFVVEPVKSPERRRTGDPRAGGASLQLRRAGLGRPMSPRQAQHLGGWADTWETHAVATP